MTKAWKVCLTKGFEGRESFHGLIVKCPFHVERTPSGVYDPKTHQYHCFGCGKTADVNELVVALIANRQGKQPAMDVDMEVTAGLTQSLTDHLAALGVVRQRKGKRPRRGGE